MDPAGLTSEVGIKVAHEAGKLADVVDVEQKVKMIREEGKTAAADFVKTLGASEHADDDVVELRAGPEKETAVDGPAGDLDQGPAFGYVTESSSHAQIRRKIDPESSSP